METSKLRKAIAWIVSVVIYLAAVKIVWTLAIGSFELSRQALMVDLMVLLLTLFGALAFSIVRKLFRHIAYPIHNPHETDFYYRDPSLCRRDKK